jgi:hypothetical protein
MKKAFLLLALAGATVTVSTLHGCNSCVHTYKNLESNYGELERDITVMNSFTGDTIFKYSGPCYFDTDSGTGNISLIYKVNGSSKKADFIGNFVFTAIEK